MKERNRQMSTKRMTYTAVLTGITRQMDPSNTRALLTKVTNQGGIELRNHIFVPVEYFHGKMPKAHAKNKWLIRFTAEYCEYKSSKTTHPMLIKLKDIEVIDFKVKKEK
jgi:hypothetical protein